MEFGSLEACLSSLMPAQRAHRPTPHLSSEASVLAAVASMPLTLQGRSSGRCDTVSCWRNAARID